MNPLLRIALLAALLPFSFAGHAQDDSPQALHPMARSADPDFEVATIKPASPDDNDQGLSLKGRRISIRALNVTGLLCFAYSIHASQIINSPKWFGEQRWNIEGIPNVDGAPDWDQYRHMLRKLLASRFGVQLHPDKRELSVYTLTVTSGGQKLADSKSAPDSLPDASGHGIGAQQYMKFTNHTMSSFAQTMQLMTDKPVVNQTGLTGRYDFELLWTPDVVRATESDQAPALFTAVQQQLGLKLQAARVPTDVFIIDAATLPTEN